MELTRRSGAKHAGQAELRLAVTEILEAPVSDAAEADASSDAVARLSALGSNTGPVCFDLLVGHTLSPLARVRARAALSTLEAPPLWAHLGWLATQAPVAVVQALGVELLAERGTGEQLSLLCRLVEPATREQDELERSLERAFEQALAAILVRDPGSEILLEYQFTRSHQALVRPIVRGLGLSRTEGALEVLSHLMLGDDEFDAIVLNQMAVIAASGRRLYSNRARANVRVKLAMLSGPKSQHQAVLTAAYLEDHEAVPLLIDLLENEDESLARDAYGSLTRLTGLQFRPEARRWQEWLAEELDFWNLRAPDLFRSLDRGHSSAVRLALAELCDRRGFRHDLAEEVVEVLSSSEEELVLAALAALQRLDSLVALEPLIELLDDRRDTVRGEALRVLSAITREDHGPEPDSWRAAFALGP